MSANGTITRIPRGRPAQRLAQYVRDQTDDGEALVAFWIGVVNDTGAEMKDRIAASRELANRGWGRSMQPIEVSRPDGPSQFDPSAYDDAELEALETVMVAIQERRATGQVGDARLRDLVEVLLPSAPRPDPVQVEIDKTRAGWLSVR